MKVKEYFNDYNSIFDSTEVAEYIDSMGLDFLEDTDLFIIDHFIRSDYGPCLLDVEDATAEEEAKMMAVAVLYKNRYLYQGIYDALTTEFDPLALVDITEIIDGEDAGSNTKTGKEVDSGSNSQTTTPNITVTDTPTTTIETQNRTFDDNTLTAVEKQINGGTATSKTTGTNTVSGTSGNTKEFQNVKDQYSNTKDETRTRTGHDSIDYRKAIEDLYETKRISLINRIVEDYATEIIIKLYCF